MSDRKGMRKREVLLMLCLSATFITAQVTFDPDPEGDVQLQSTSLRPPVKVTTVLCYSSSPTIKVQYVNEDSGEVVYDVIYYYYNFAVTGDTCAGDQSQYGATLERLRFISEPVLVGGRFHLKATVNNNEENSTLSRRTYTFPAPFNLTGSSLSAVLNTQFTWTCHVTSDYPILEWYMGRKNLGHVGILPNGSCASFQQVDSYIYGCQQSALTYTLTIPGSNLTAELMGSTWRCHDVYSYIKGSKFMELNIIVPVTYVTISPSSDSAFNVDEDQVITFTCSINDADPPPMILWFIGSSDVTSQARSNRTVFTLTVTWDIDNMSVKCLAWNSGNMANLSDSTTLKVRSSAKFFTDQHIQLERLNTTASIEIPFYCNPPVIMSGVEWINMTGMNGQLMKSSETISFSLSDVDVDRVIGNTIRGQKAVMHITSVQRYHRGYYVVKIQNSASFVSTWGFMLDVSVLPDPPANLTVQCREGVAQLSWTSPDIYSSELSFQLLYKEDDEGTYTVLEKKYDGRSKSLNANIRNIKPNTVYHFKIASKNVHGLSEYTEIKTCVIFDNNLFTSSTGPSIGGVAGGITAVFLVLTAVLIGVMVMRERRYRIEKGERVKGNKASFEKYENIQSGSTSNEQVISGKEIENRDERSNYEELQTSRDVNTYDHVDNRTQYMNLEACLTEM